MKERTKEIMRDGFGCLVKNNAAIRGAKNGPLWLTIVMFFLSILLPILPFFIAGATSSGASFLRSNTYGLEKTLTVTALELKDENYEFVIGEDHLLTVKKDGSTINYSDYDNKADVQDDRIISPLKAYINQETNQYDFVLYVSDLEKGSEKTAYLKKVTSYLYETNTHTVTADDAATIKANKKDGSKSYYYPSFMVVFKNSFNLVVCYGEKSVTGSTNGSTDYKTMTGDKYNLNALLTVTDKDGNNVAPALNNPDYYNGVINNFRKFLNKSYESSKIKNTLTTCLFNLALFAGLSLIMGFMIWILTRGKNNPNNYFSLWLCFKIEARLGLAPGLLTLIIGIFLTSYAQMIFVLTLGLRVMWMSMKELRPVQG